MKKNLLRISFLATLVLAAATFSLMGEAPRHLEGAHAPASFPAAHAQVSFKKTKLYLKDGNFHADIDIANFSPNGGIYQCDILHETLREKDRYYVLDVQAESRPGGNGNGNGECGAGIEKFAVWMHINENFAVDEMQMFLYESCWHNSGGKIERKMDTLELRYGKIMELNPKTSVFDPAKPERGFVSR